MVNRSSTRYDRSTTRSTMLSISDDSASARNPTWPRLDPEQRRVRGHHPLGSAQDCSVTAQDDHQFRDRAFSVTPPGELSDARGQVRAQAGQILGRHSNLDASRAQALDQSHGAGDCGWSTWMGEDGNAANRKRMTVRRAHLPQHRAAVAAVPGTTASRSAGSDRHRKWRSGEQGEEFDVACRPGQPARHDGLERPTPGRQPLS